MGRTEEIVYTLAGMSAAVLSLAMFPFALAGSPGLVSISSVVAVTSAALSAFFGIYVHRQRQRFLTKKRVFIIYNHRDLDVATTLVAQLKAAGYSTWFDQEDIRPGERIEEALMSGLAQSVVAIVLISKNIESSSKWLSTEINLALSVLRSKSALFSPVIPLRLDDAPIPHQLQGVNWIRMNDADDFERLKKGLDFALQT